MSTEVIVASTPADAEAVDTIRTHHAHLAGAVAARTDAMLTAIERGDGFEASRAAAVDFLTTELLPHAKAEEDSLYPAAARTERLRPLIESMIAAHRVIGALVDRVRTEPPVRAAAAGHALRVLFDAHLTDENDRVVPVVAADPHLSLAGITHGMHELLGEAPHTPAAHPHQGCACGESDTGDPVLDVREIPHAIRHATVFGAFDSVPAGGALVLVAPHDPVPLLRQLADRSPGRVAVDYEERGPQAWRLRLTKV